MMDIFHPHFSPDITLGHLLQAAVVVVTGGGGMLGGYLSLRSDIDVQRAEYRVALAGHEVRLAQAERELDERRREDRAVPDRDARVARAGDGGDRRLRTELVQKQNRR